MHRSTSFVHSTLIVSLALGLIACGQQAAAPATSTQATPQDAGTASCGGTRLVTSNTTIFRDVAADASGNLYVVGADRQGEDPVIQKYSSSGQLLWSKDPPITLWDIRAELASKIVVDKAGNLAVSLAGLRRTSDNQRVQVFAKYSQSGRLLWSQVTQQDRPEDFYPGRPALIATDDANNLYAATSRVTKYSPAGALVWERSYPFGNGGGNALAVGPTGFVFSAYDYPEITLTKRTPEGWLASTKQFDIYNGLYPDEAAALGVAAARDGSVYTIYRKTIFHPYINQTFLNKYDKQSNWQFSKQISGPGFGQTPAMLDIDAQGNLYVSGTSSDKCGAERQGAGFVAQYDSSGNKKWSVSYLTEDFGNSGGYLTRVINP